jgi:hypothetical protein
MGEIEVIDAVLIGAVRRPHKTSFRPAPGYLGGPEDLAMIFPVDHIIRGIHMVLIHKITAPRGSDIVRRIDVKPAVSPDMRRRVGRIDIRNKRVLGGADPGQKSRQEQQAGKSFHVCKKQFTA